MLGGGAEEDGKVERGAELLLPSAGGVAAGAAGEALDGVAEEMAVVGPPCAVAAGEVRGPEAAGALYGVAGGAPGDADARGADFSPDRVVEGVGDLPSEFAQDLAGDA